MIHWFYPEIFADIETRIIPRSYDRMFPDEFMMTEDNDQKVDLLQKKRRDFPLEWVKRSREGDNQAREALYQHFKSAFFSLAYRYTYNAAAAEDLLQDIFIKIFTHIHVLDQDEAFTGWAYRIAVNTCLSYLRSRKTAMKKTVPLNDVEIFLADDKGVDSEKMLKKSLDEAIRGLSVKLRSVFILHDIQGFKHEEIALMLGCSIGTSKSQLFKARMKIRKQLECKQLI
jgi:RNA polymerase sigma-70 factor (ECF subfamily)